MGFGLQFYGRTLAYNMTDSGFYAQNHKKKEKKRKEERKKEGKKKRKKLIKKD